MKIKFKLFLIFFTVSAIPLVLVSIFVFYNAKNHLEDLIIKNLNLAADLKTHKIEVFFKDIRTGLETAQGYYNIRKNLPVVEKNFNNKTNSNYIDSKEQLDSQMRILQSVQKFDSVILVDTLGRIVYCSNPDYEKKYLGNSISNIDSVIFENSKDKIFFADPYKREGGEKIIGMMVAAPMHDFEGKFIGEVIFDINLNLIYDQIKINQNINGTEETVIGKKISDKEIVVINPLLFDKDAALNKKISVGDNFSIPLQKALDKSNGSGMAIDYRGVEVLAGWRYFSDLGWGMISKIDASEGFAPINDFKRVIFLVVVADFIVVLLIISVASRSILGPIEKLRRGVEIISSGNLDYKVGIKDGGEIGELSAAFDKMAVKLKESYQGLEQKIRDRTADLQKFELAVENASDHIVITDTNGKILYANKAAETITGYLREEMKEKTPALWGKQMEKEFYEKFWHTIKDGKKMFSGQVNNRRKNGEQYIAEIHVSPVLDERNEINFFVGIERDITKEKEVEKAKSEFVSIASHQLQTPITAIKWVLERFLKTEKITLKGREYLEDIHFSVKRLSTLVNELLNISRIERQVIHAVPKNVDLVKFIEQGIKEWKPLLLKKKISIDFEKSFASFAVEADENILGNIFQCLISNAIEYTPDGGKILVVLKEENDGRFLIAVKDTGIGIPELDKRKIFEKFGRANNAKLLKPDGTGLGLYIAFQAVGFLEGKIWFESEENKGSAFYVELPVKLTPKLPKIGMKELI